MYNETIAQKIIEYTEIAAKIYPELQRNQKVKIK